MATPQTTTEPLRPIPSAADGVDVAGNAAAWGNSAWVELSGGLTDPIVLNAIVVQTPSAPTDNQEAEWDIGSGDAGSEVVVATTAITGARIDVAGLPGWAQGVLPFEILVDNIPANTRISTRFRNSPAVAETWNAKLLYYHSLAPDNVGTTASAPEVSPSAANGVTVTPSSTAWADTSWVELNASLTDVVALGLIELKGDHTAVSEFEADIGIGAAGSEVVVGTVSGAMPELEVSDLEHPRGSGRPYPFAIPIELAGTNRVAVRMRKEDTRTATWTFKLHHVSTSDFDASDPYETTQPQRQIPDPGPGIACTSAASIWGNGAWVEFSAGEANAIVLGAISLDMANTMQVEVDVGTGAVGLETVVTTFANNRTGTASDTIVYQSPALLDNVPASTRIACRVRDNVATAEVHLPNLQVYDRPL